MAKGLFYFLDKNLLHRPLCSARHECARGVRGGPQRGSSIYYRLSSVLSKQANTSSLYYYGFQNFPPLLLWLGRKVPFTLSLEACSSTGSLLSSSASSQLCYYCKIIDALVKFLKTVAFIVGKKKPQQSKSFLLIFPLKQSFKK